MFIGEEPKTLEECFERLKKDRDRLIDECDFPSNYNRFNEPATEEQIEKLEKTHNIKLPEEYKEFLRFTNGATIMGTSATIYGTDMFGVRDMIKSEEKKARAAKDPETLRKEAEEAKIRINKFLEERRRKQNEK